MDYFYLLGVARAVFLAGALVGVSPVWASRLQNTLTMPPAAERSQMIQDLSTQMQRIDGDGLLARANRPETWDTTITRLAGEASSVSTLYDLGRVFRRVDATYPNLHAYTTLAKDLDETQKSGVVALPLIFAPAQIDASPVSADFRISQVDATFAASNNVRLGDQIVAINGTAMQSWVDQGFLFCKFPLQQQCALEFYDDFTAEVLGWNRHTPLTLTLTRGRQTWTINVPVATQTPTHGPQPTCAQLGADYPGFTTAFNGYNLCAYQSASAPGVVVMRIYSFEYPNNMSLSGEVNQFWTSYWQKQAPLTKKLIIDVMTNYGGDAPMPYYAVLFSAPFQEEYVEFKKIAEFLQSDILASLFWGEPGKTLWLNDIQKDGTYAAVPTGGFLVPVPQFCADESKDCRQGLFPNQNNQFTGQVDILVNHWCVSSCVGFVYNVAAVLGAQRVTLYGAPDSGDSAYGRLAVLLQPGATPEIVAGDATGGSTIKSPWVKQVASVTKSTDAAGNLLSGQPTTVQNWIARLWSQTDDQWETAVFQAALAGP